MTTSDAVSWFAIAISAGALWYSHRSANAAEASAVTARQALEFQREARTSEESERRNERLRALAKEAVDDWRVNGCLVPILDREIDLSPADQEDLARRVYRVLGKTDAEALHAIAEWRRARMKG